MPIRLANGTVRDAGEGARFAKRGEGGKSALFQKSYDNFDN